VGARRIISLRMRRLLSIDDLNAAIRGGRGPATPGEFVVLLTDRLQERMRHVVEALYDQVDQLEVNVITESNMQQREQLAGIRRQTIAMRRFLSPQREALSRLSSERTPLLDDRDRLRLREEYDHLTRMVEDLDAARERATVVHETLTSRVAEMTNQRMYVLSIIAAIFLPLSFVTGLLGVNVGGIPGAENPYGFWSVDVLLLLVAAGIWAFFRWRQWF
jgi:zinc transporter